MSIRSDVVAKIDEKARALGSYEILLITRSGDRLHRGCVEEAVLDEMLVNMNADDLTESDESRCGFTVNILEPNSLEPLAFQRAR